ncbi:hypothetical protein LEP1GSC151_3148 [Leptospira interrogans serovar Grippotyphosa str. LT2186]|uniref:Uncharacterized protein n=2 Tax=Leptospira interrogans TaxID=173 RepID=M3I957_LEPIR|nr:hypothetical protein LEP1GSC151_3148 [Leptospira interrogans serovar Grippotyphosa str. LT2186]
MFWTPLENLEVDLQTNAESFDDGSLNIVNYLASKTERRKSLVKGCVVSPEVCDKNIRTYINRTKAVRKVFWDYEGVSNTTGKTYSSNITYKLPKAIFKTVYSIRKMEIDPLIVDGDFTRSPVIKSEYIEHSTTRTHETSIESKNKKEPLQFKIGTLFYHKISDKEFIQERLMQAYTYNVLKGLNAPAKEIHHSRVVDKSFSFFTHNSYTF